MKFGFLSTLLHVVTTSFYFSPTPNPSHKGKVQCTVPDVTDRQTDRKIKRDRQADSHFNFNIVTTSRNKPVSLAFKEIHKRHSKFPQETAEGWPCTRKLIPYFNFQHVICTTQKYKLLQRYAHKAFIEVTQS